MRRPRAPTFPRTASLAWLVLLPFPVVAPAAAQSADSPQAEPAAAAPDALPAEGSPGSEPDPQAAAGQAFEIGMRLMEEQNWAGALAAFQRAYDLAPHYAVLFNIGFCQKQLQRYPEALEAFQRYLAEGGDQVRPEKRVEAEQAIADLQIFLSRVRVVVSVDGAEVRVDGVPRGTSPLPAPLVLGAGHHLIEARAAEHRDARVEFDLGGAEEREVSLTLETLVAVAPPPPPPPPPPPEPPPPEVPPPAPVEPDEWYDDWLGWTLGGVGLVATGIGTTILVGAAGSRDEASQLADLQDAHNGLVDAADASLLGGTLAGVGAALLVTGIVLLAVPPGGDESPPEAGEAEVAWQPLVGPGGLGLVVTF
ncbi:MAG: tetratricopeptide repeat protein [Deltaproteobacteria bacterium]|nr:tetratricopeptide repeat protein [Deltaproteobacteria bacterium]